MSDIIKLEIANAIAEKLWILGLLSDKELEKVKVENHKQLIKS